MRSRRGKLCRFFNSVFHNLYIVFVVDYYNILVKALEEEHVCVCAWDLRLCIFVFGRCGVWGVCRWTD
jgi:hypothetical protein